MLIAKGYRVSLKLVSGGVRRVPASYAMLHDSRGYDWPACSCLIAPFRKGGGDLRNKDEAESYFGYSPKAGSMMMPTRVLSAWKEVGEVAEIDYFRPGADDSTRGDFFHPFERTEGWWIFRSGQYPLLYRLGSLLRVELGDGCVWNDRGFVSP